MENTTQVQATNENTAMMPQNLTTEQAMKELSLPENYGKNMTPEVARKIEGLKKTINIHDSGKVIAYGREQQAQIGKFSDSILNGVATTSIGEAGELLTSTIGDIKGYNLSCEKETSGLFGFLKKQKSKIQNMQTKYRSVSANIDLIVKDLQQKDLDLGKVSRGFDTMYAENIATYEFLSMAIFAGQEVLKEERIKLEEMQRNAEASGDMMEVQRVADYKDNIIKFERRLYDLALTRAICVQQAPQIRNIQKGADEVSESIKTTISTAIPLWKNQMALALGMRVVEQGLNAVNAAKDLTNAMLLANSEKNKQLTLQTAEAVERGVIDIETINTVNQNLIEALAGSYDITQKAIADRAAGIETLGNNENTLKNALTQYARLN